MAGPKPKQGSKKIDQPKHPGGFVDRLLHGDHGHASESEDAQVSDPNADQKSDEQPKNDEPGDSGAPIAKKNSDEGASSESKHHHKKFDKFKRGK